MRHAHEVILLTVLSLAVAGGTSFAQSTQPPPDWIEEDWSLVIGSPDPALEGPQISTSMKLSGDDSSPFVIFNLNYRDQPNYQPGGLQVNAWSNGQVVSSSNSGSAQCQTDNETITWTQRISLSGGNVNYNYKITSVQSHTWDQDTPQLADRFATSVTSLSGYSPDTSVANSGVSFASDLVKSMTLQAVRYYYLGTNLPPPTLLWTDPNPPRSITLSN